MTEYTATITDLSGNVVGINPNSLRYAKNLNKFNEGNFKINGLDVLTRQSITEGAIVKIYKNGTLDFEGIIDSKTQFSGGVMAIHFNGSEFQMTKENTFSTELWKNTASSSIFSSIVGNSSTWTTGTIDTGVNTDFRIQDSDNIWNTTGNLSNKTSQDLALDYSTKQISLLNYQGSQTSVVSLIYENNIKNITFQTTYPVGNKVKVYGKGDGTSQIVSETSHGQDTSSQTTYGIIPKTIRDLTVISIDEANKLADSTVAYTKLPQKVYTFEVTDLTLSTKIVEGDVITIDAPEYDLNEEEVRVVSIERGFESEEILVFQVTNKEYAKAQKRRNQIIGEIEKSNRDSQTYMQGTTNVLTFSEMINADSTAPLRVKGFLSEDFIKDEADNLRVEKFTLDYDVDPYRSGIGTASEDNVAPSVNGTSSSTQPGVSGSSGETDLFNVSATDFFSNVSCSSGSWTTLAFHDGVNFPNNLGENLFATMKIEEISGGPEDILILLEHSYYGDVLLQSIAGFDSSIADFQIGGIQIGEFTSTGNQIRLRIYPQTGSITVSGNLAIGFSNHDHADGSYSADNHDHADGSYSASSHNHNVSIGDGVSDSGSINATGVNIYLDFWNGSSWIQKHSILNTGKTIDTNVDISNGGVYPDSSGFWQVRVYTNNTTADLVQGTIKCKHELDT